jgi:hypothetical protein
VSNSVANYISIFVEEFRAIYVADCHIPNIIANDMLLGPKSLQERAFGLNLRGDRQGRRPETEFHFEKKVTILPRVYVGLWWTLKKEKWCQFYTIHGASSSSSFEKASCFGQKLG